MKLEEFRAPEGMYRVIVFFEDKKWGIIGDYKTLDEAVARAVLEESGKTPWTSPEDQFYVYDSSSEILFMYMILAQKFYITHFLKNQEILIQKCLYM